MRVNNFFISAQRPVGIMRTDSGLAASIVLLLGLGLITLYITSASYASRIFGDPLYFIKRQSISIALGFVFLPN